MAPSTAQYAAALPLPATQRGAARVTPATGSPIAETGIAEPSLIAVQSSAVIVLVSAPCGADATGNANAIRRIGTMRRSMTVPPERLWLRILFEFRLQRLLGIVDANAGRWIRESTD